jgi:uncharacterized protein (TIGR02611 family)
VSVRRWPRATVWGASTAPDVAEAELAGIFSVVDRARRLLGIIARSTRRLAVLIVGCGVTAAGLVMIVTPGPGIVVIVAGLAILATEFTWAEILLERAKKQAVKAKDAAVRGGAGLLRRRRTITVEVTEVDLVEIDSPSAALHGPPTPHGHVEIVAITVTERTDTVDAD